MDPSTAERKVGGGVLRCAMAPRKPLLACASVCTPAAQPLVPCGGALGRCPAASHPRLHARCCPAYCLATGPQPAGGSEEPGQHLLREQRASGGGWGVKGVWVLHWAGLEKLEGAGSLPTIPAHPGRRPAHMPAPPPCPCLLLSCPRPTPKCLFANTAFRRAVYAAQQPLADEPIVKQLRCGVPAAPGELHLRCRRVTVGGSSCGPRCAPVPPPCPAPPLLPCDSSASCSWQWSSAAVTLQTQSPWPRHSTWVRQRCWGWRGGAVHAAALWLRVPLRSGARGGRSACSRRTRLHSLHRALPAVPAVPQTMACSRTARSL